MEGLSLVQNETNSDSFDLLSLIQSGATNIPNIAFYVSVFRIKRCN